MKSKVSGSCVCFLVLMLFNISNAQEFNKNEAEAEIKKITESAQLLQKNLNDDLTKLEDLRTSFPEYVTGPVNPTVEHEKVTEMKKNLKDLEIECDFDKKVEGIGFDILNEAAKNVSDMVKKDFVSQLDNIENDLTGELKAESERCEKTKSTCQISENFSQAMKKANDIIEVLSQFRKSLRTFFEFTWTSALGKIFGNFTEKDFLKRVDQIYSDCLYKNTKPSSH